jgi:transcriptional regulator with XRE-family HTH domain
MAPRILSYLRTHRKRGGLTQDEMAFLLGCQSGTKISRFERLARRPNLRTALACQVVFGVPAHKLFPGLFAEVEKTVIERARLLSGQLEVQSARGRTGARHKLAILKAITREKSEGPPNDA